MARGATELALRHGRRATTRLRLQAPGRSGDIRSRSRNCPVRFCA